MAGRSQQKHKARKISKEISSRPHRNEAFPPVQTYVTRATNNITCKGKLKNKVKRRRQTWPSPPTPRYLVPLSYRPHHLLTHQRPLIVWNLLSGRGGIFISLKTKILSFRCWTWQPHCNPSPSNVISSASHRCTNSLSRFSIVSLPSNVFQTSCGAPSIISSSSTYPSA